MCQLCATNSAANRNAYYSHSSHFRSFTFENVSMFGFCELMQFRLSLLPCVKAGHLLQEDEQSSESERASTKLKVN